MEERTFDRNDIDHVEADQGRAEAAREIKGIGLRDAGMFGRIDADQDFLDHRLPRVTVRDTMAAGRGSRGRGSERVSRDERAEESRIERVLDELAEAAERFGLKVRRERILREVGYRARGGACRLREKDLVIIDRDQPPARATRNPGGGA